MITDITTYPLFEDATTIDLSDSAFVDLHNNYQCVNLVFDTEESCLRLLFKKGLKLVQAWLSAFWSL